VTEDPSNVDDAQLERWAYGRATTPKEQERAKLAAAELQRRAALERKRAQLAAAERAAANAHARAVANSEADDAAREHPAPLTDSERRHRRRMLATGISGVVAAALALGAGVVVLSQPNPDPLAMFARPATSLDHEWAGWISENLPVQDSFASRVLELDDDVVAFVFRAPAVAGGRSTEWDPYCLFTADSRVLAEADVTGGLCVLPERLTTEGLVMPIRPGLDEGEYDTVVWGPVGSPRVERDRQINFDELYGSGSVVDSLAFSSFLPNNALNYIDDPDRLLIGPTPLGNSVTGSSAVEAYGYVLRADTQGTGETFCLLLVANDETTETSCDSLSSVRAGGLDMPFTSGGQSLTVRLGADGTQGGLSWELLD
jgi:hypothetical protein